MSNTLQQQFIEELQEEAKATRATLALVPLDKGSYSPHEKSMKLINLTSHIAEIPGWFVDIINHTELDFATMEYKPFIPSTQEELLSFFDKKVADAIALLQNTEASKFDESWTMRSGDIIYFTLPKGKVIRTWCLNHWYHHRAQLGVYLRMLDIPLPGVYGPSADMQ